MNPVVEENSAGNGASITPPTMNDSRMWDFVLGHFSYYMLLTAHKLKLFALLAQKPQTAQAVAIALNLALRPTQAMLTACAAMAFVQVDRGYYSLTKQAEEYLLEDSPTYFGGFLDMVTANHQVNSYESLQKAVLTNSSQVYASGDLFESHQEQAALARAFTVAMHGHSMAAALAWTEIIDLTQHQVFLDIGGGSGAHSIAAALKWQHLQAIVADLPPVCEVATEFIARYGLEARAIAQPIDMWNDPFPAADLHFYADIYHDWTPEQGEILTRKSFESLPSGGRLILHEMLLNDAKTGPATAANYNIAMLLWTEGQQYSEPELVALLNQVGFIEIEVKASKGYWSVITGRKP